MLVAGVFVVGWIIVSKVESDVKAAASLVDPTSENNVVNQGVEHIGQAISGDKYWTLGGWLYDWTHNTAQYTAPTPLPSPAPDATHGVVGGGA